MTTSHIPASIEVSAKQAADSTDLPGLFPVGTRIYITDLGLENDLLLVKGARRLADLGYRAVPHLAARRIDGHGRLEARIGTLSQEAGVSDILVIGGDPDRPAGQFTSTMDVLETGLFDRFGIRDIAIAGHPEGNREYSTEVALEVLRAKAAFGERTGAQMRIVTQFGFDAPRFLAWAREIEALGIDLPVHLGVAGPAKLTTLIKYAIACGMQDSLSFLRKRALSITALATSHSPEDVVGQIEQHYRASPESNIQQIHVFAFGGLKTAAAWLHDRGSWDAPAFA